MIVMKFGGTSLQSWQAIQQAISIIRTRISRKPVVVVSALGKVTDSLLALGREAAAGDQRQWSRQLRKLQHYHSAVALELCANGYRKSLVDFLDCHFDELQALAEGLNGSGQFTPVAQDAITSFGERLSSGIVAFALRGAGVNSVHFDSRALICSDARHTQATPVLPATYTKMRAALNGVPPGTVPVLGGFIATSTDGATTTLGRNSSNLTAVLVAAAMGAECVEIWTDVDGVFHHDPRHVADQCPVEELSFREALQLAKRGAKVLHAGAVLLASQANIPIHIRNAARPNLSGSRISAAPLAGCEIGAARNEFSSREQFRD